ncbi:MAG: nucleoside-diphosphate kinase [Candidatus Komeilibacteria bacterium CG_4_10_14_0_2_um_filter_37_10]|uniref:nucleoside-diphosphate kinase n=1 Tax=Candidatus Komeilibacteria bacterium CG_4_10_14_0_2_um_filter_37_10 TaxID=1974470 RepID=A0A2M7VEG9_9BACT|nr:MAG: nucleoside-diphosphate kinase [Candidatus Komeilibacteria bacterium CG_4_10_14_0_2_um_filter_37_10]PJA93704.1 MAG: nucleoside-diphosphate kinase [Candidatus Komeilibacteria bacterium CG_4_9_14_3_um_filter_37_5]
MLHPRKERTFVILKPDAVQRGLIGDVICRLEKTGLKLIALKMIIATEDQLWRHYQKDEQWFTSKGQRILEERKAAGLPIEKEAREYGKDIVQALVKFMSCGPIVPMIWEGNQAAGIVKKIIGSTEPLTSDSGTIRGDYTLDSYEIASLDNRAVRNLVHCSDPASDALREIPIWFSENEILNYRLIAEQILYDINLDGIKE